MSQQNFSHYYENLGVKLTLLFDDTDIAELKIENLPTINVNNASEEYSEVCEKIKNIEVSNFKLYCFEIRWTSQETEYIMSLFSKIKIINMKIRLNFSNKNRTRNFLLADILAPITFQEIDIYSTVLIDAETLFDCLLRKKLMKTVKFSSLKTPKGSKCLRNYVRRSTGNLGKLSIPLDSLLQPLSKYYFRSIWVSNIMQLELSFSKSESYFLLPTIFTLVKSSVLEKVSLFRFEALDYERSTFWQAHIYSLFLLLNSLRECVMVNLDINVNSVAVISSIYNVFLWRKDSFIAASTLRVDTGNIEQVLKRLERKTTKQSILLFKDNEL
eukprot:snap_masked-scaffold_81-processed-gene-0.24-mRNA-1 protein AED:1.00 eAED:1.00 QI:0/0/0/0/1/1/3/0/327